MKIKNYLLRKVGYTVTSICIIIFFISPTALAAEEKLTRTELINQIAQITDLIQKLQAQISSAQGGNEEVFVHQYHAYNEDAIILDAVSWFKNAQEFNGHFRYEYMPFLDRTISDDHIVRQAGAFYGLGEVAVHDTQNTLELKNLLEKSANYFMSNSTQGELGGYSFTCLLQGNDKCTLGGTSLALVGFIDMISAYPELESVYKSTIDGYKNYVLAMKKDAAGFRNFYYRYTEQTPTESAFSNGEALLALVRYHDKYPSTDLKASIDEAYDYFSQQEYDGSFYLWGMAAVKDLYLRNPKDEYVTYAKDYTDWRMSTYTTKRGITRNMCAYIEGVVSAYSVIEATATLEESAKYREEIDFWLSRSSGLQVHEGDSMFFTYNTNTPAYAGLKNTQKAIGGFLTGYNEPVQRIDFTQHCLNSYLQKKVDIDGKSF